MSAPGWMARSTTWMKRSPWTDIKSIPSKRLLTDWSFNDTENEEDERAFRSRLTDSVETALKVGEGYLTVQNCPVEPPEDLFFSEHLACPEHGVSLPEIEPRTFSFNTPHGACPDCQGLGSRLEIDPDLLIPDQTARSMKVRSSPWNGMARANRVGITGKWWRRLRSNITSTWMLRSERSRRKS